MNSLVLSLFPGIDLQGRAFEEEGYCVVRGPDLLWGGDIRTFHPPAGVFDGVIGGPPCKGDSNLAYLNNTAGITLVHEFIRCLKEAQPKWWVMEAVRNLTHLPFGKRLHLTVLNPRWLGEKQNRKRYFHSSLNLNPYLEVALFEHPEWKHAVLAVHGGREGTIVRGMATYKWEEMCELQGLPADFDLPPFTRAGKREVLGNAVPMVMGREIAKAVKRANEAP